MEGRKRWRGRERGGLKKREKDKTKPTKTMMTVSGESKDERAHAATAVTAAPSFLQLFPPAHVGRW
jgi:hypothetical protein